MTSLNSQDHFYVTLPSNSSYSFYGKQLIGSYKTKLSAPIIVDPLLWEVGLASIVYPRSWANIKSPTFTIHVLVNVREEGPFVFYDKVDYTLPLSRYENAAHLIDELDAAIVNDPQKRITRAQCRFEYDRLTKRGIIRLAEHYLLEIPEQLAVPLGFGRGKTVYLSRGPPLAFQTNKVRTMVGQIIKTPHTVNPNRYLEELYVYSDIVTLQRVGDTVAPLLRSVTDNNGSMSVETVVSEFRHIQYLPLQSGSIESIEIHIADSGGRVVDFAFGDVIVTLHFRKR